MTALAKPATVRFYVDADVLGLVRDAGARMVTLAGAEARGTWEQLEIVMSRWRDIAALVDTPGPFIYSATRTRLRRISLT